ncbi:MAG: hypothetical protein CME71_03725 [Halobacteriovorax sp.]|nr:hypothetical protein [Halobacteriovorax sp.]
MNSIEKLKLKKLLENDLAKASELFGEHEFSALAESYQVLANEAFEHYLVKSPADQTYKFDQLKSIDLATILPSTIKNLALRLHESESGLWLKTSDQIINQTIPTLGISFYDCDNRKIYSIHAGEYEWEIYLNV